jgi:hypothetical protein
MAFSLQDHFTNLPDAEEEEAYIPIIILSPIDSVDMTLKRRMMVWVINWTRHSMSTMMRLSVHLQTKWVRLTHPSKMTVLMGW